MPLFCTEASKDALPNRHGDLRSRKIGADPHQRSGYQGSRLTVLNGSHGRTDTAHRDDDRNAVGIGYGVCDVRDLQRGRSRQNRLAVVTVEPVAVTVIFSGFPFVSRVLVIFVFNVIYRVAITLLPEFPLMQVITILPICSARPAEETKAGRLTRIAVRSCLGRSCEASQPQKKEAQENCGETSETAEGAKTHYLRVITRIRAHTFA